MENKIKLGIWTNRFRKEWMCYSVMWWWWWWIGEKAFDREE